MRGSRRKARSARALSLIQLALLQIYALASGTAIAVLPLTQLRL